ncbi:MMPL family transporter [Mycobacterium koreense]|uniref:SSD domain-containing protein n=1 Tax=Mycolicibacillus koreensis TaxID=1069220 RepID=A0AA91PC02_9MYCO|nr:MMPL family transporter [Mycolicibacillus koreensis]MCV7248679.1 MMPL family transporter [Mycolicibacillus koreensis]OSC31160.1 hypothetical protein B8W67_16540 [Mycolicibacillus koreensis]
MMHLSRNLRRFRWLVFTGWLLALLPAVYLALTQSGQLTGGGFEVSGSQSLYVQHRLEEHFPTEGASPLALVAAPRSGASYEDMADAVSELQRAAAAVPAVSVVPDPTQPDPRPDRPYVVILQLDFDNTGAVDTARQLRQRIGVDGEEPGRTDNGQVRLYVIGQGALGAAAADKTKQDIAQAERWNLPVVLIVLLAVFGSLTAATIPLALGVCTVVVTMGLVYLLSEFTTMSVFVTSTVSMFGIALAIDYSLFILMRYREELRAGRQPQEAVDAAMATSGLAVVLSGLTVIASVCGIYLINTPVLVSMATGAILAVAVAVLTAATLTPAVLATFGRRAAQRAALLHWSRRPELTESRFWTRWVGWVMRRPWLSALAAATLLILMTAPAFTMALGNSMLRQFDSSHEARGGMAAAAQALGPGALGPVRVLVTFPDGAASAPGHAATLERLNAAMQQAPNVVSVSPPVFSDDDAGALISAVLGVDPEDMAARQSVDWMREQLPERAGIAASQLSVGGPTALIKDFDDRVAATEGWVLVFVALIAFVMLLLAIQSVVLALKGVLMTMLSVGAAYGSLVVVFQWGWLEQLGFKPLSSIDSTIPPLVLAMTFGLSMDYEIFLLTRIRERFLESGNTRDAVAYGVSTSARTITSAALIMIAVFIGFAFAGMPLVAQLGVACAVAIAIDATVVRLVLVPALMAMFAKWNWWLPHWLDRVLPSVDFEKPLPEVDLGDVVLIPDDISALAAPAADLRMVLKSSAKLQHLAPESVAVADPLAFSGCQRTGAVGHRAPALASVGTARRITGRAAPRTVRPVHPVTVWCCRLRIALDALQAESDSVSRQLRRISPVEITTVQLATGDRLQIPTAAETVRLKGYLLATRNSRRDFVEFADLVDALEPAAAAVALAGIDAHYRARSSQPRWIASQLVRRLADPRPVADPADLHTADGGDADTGDGAADPDWDDVRRRCLAVAVAMLEEAR